MKKFLLTILIAGVLLCIGLAIAIAWDAETNPYLNDPNFCSIRVASYTGAGEFFVNVSGPQSRSVCVAVMLEYASSSIYAGYSGSPQFEPVRCASDRGGIKVEVVSRHSPVASVCDRLGIP